MAKINRRRFLQYLAVTGAAGLSYYVGFRWWQAGNVERSATMDETFPAPAIPGSMPLLLLTNERSTNPFGRYLAEILRAEGLNLFQVADLQTLDAETLRQVALVLLAEGPVDSVQARMLETYVTDGGRLVAMRPDSRLATMFGVQPIEGVTAEGYLQVDNEQTFDQGIATETLQFHGQADHYRPGNATVVAWLLRDATTPTGLPAITLNRYGRGWAALWAFDLARSVAYIRQGNPAWANQERDGVEGIRAHDAFVGWIDLGRIATPQADEHMRLLRQLISEMLSDLLPLPRLWYFPNASPALLVVTGDSHGNPAMNIEALLAHVEAYQGTMSIYYTPRSRSDNALRRAAGLAVQRVENWLNPIPNDPAHPPTPAQVEQWRARGHEFSLHPYVEGGVEKGYEAMVEAFQAEGYDLPADSTVRTHRILWNGWAETAKVQAAHGFGMNLDFYHIGPLFRTEAGRWAHGYFTGSGLPMRMVDESGRVINVYQLLTELADEQLLEHVNAGWEGLDPLAAIAVSRQMIDNAIERHAALVTQFHLDFYHPSSPVQAQVAQWAEGTLAYAAERKVPIWSAARLLDFLRCRDNAQFHGLAWDATERRLTFQLLAADNDTFELAVLIPASFPFEPFGPRLETAPQAEIVETRDVSRVEVDGQPVVFTIQPDGGRTYAWISVSPGQHNIDVWYARP